MARIMFASTGSNCGKTTVVCAILQALKKRQLNIKAYKCGPDYIDSMYHKAIGVESGNLDSFFCDRNEICTLLDNENISVIEGAMGFYDGISFTERASAYEISQLTDTPVVLIVNAKGMANSIGAVLKGFKDYLPNNIRGVLFNRVSPMVYVKMAEIARSCGLIPLGYMPEMEGVCFGSRHLGLEQPVNIKHKLNMLSEQAEKSIFLDEIISLASSSNPMKYDKIIIEKKYEKNVAVAYDEAFSFIYEDNINLLNAYGCNIRYFSPLIDKQLPECDRLIISGGYPEIYADRLAENKELMNDIKFKIKGGLKTIAECGGFMYLHDKLQSIDGSYYDMVGLIEGECYKTDKLQRFGYFNMKAENDNLICNKGDNITVHEFHYWDSTNCGNGFNLTKPLSERNHKAVISTDSFYGGFPHIYLWGNRNAAEKFLED